MVERVRAVTGRAVAVSVAAVCLLLLGAGPAAAHGRGSQATNFRSEITAAPELQGVTWQVHGADEYLAVTNTTDAELVVEGYDGEPYLRIGPDGVFANQASAATYLNADRHAEVGPLPSGVGANEPPRWEKVAQSPSYAWHDHRIHFMGIGVPPAVTDPGTETLVQSWTVPFTLGDRATQVSGELRWVPGPTPWPWIAGALILTAPAALGLARRSDTGAGWVPALARPAAVVLGAVALVNLTHLVDDVLAVPQPAATKALAAAQTALFVGIALFGALRGWQGRDGAFTALGVGAGALLTGQGLLYFSVLTASQTASVLPDAVTRAAVALSLAQALPVWAVAFAGNRRLAAQAPPVTEPAVVG